MVFVRGCELTSLRVRQLFGEWTQRGVEKKTESPYFYIEIGMKKNFVRK